MKELEIADSLVKTNNLSNTIFDKEDLEITFFHKCNLSCSFCKLPRESEVGIDKESVESKFKTVRDYIERSTKNDFEIELLGGELFNDKISDEILMEIKKGVIETSRQSSKEVNFILSTNLVFDKEDRVLKLLADLEKEGIAIDFAISYDPSYRYHEGGQEETFKRNEKIFSKFITKVNFIILNGFEEYIKEDTPYFDYLYSKYPMMLSFFHTNRFLYGDRISDLKIRPNIDQLREVFRTLKDHYPEVYPVQLFNERANKRIKSFREKITCKGRVIIQPDNQVYTCAHSGHGRKEAEILEIMGEKGCFACEYYTNCYVYCYDELRSVDLDKCFYKEIYDELRSEDETNDQANG